MKRVVFFHILNDFSGSARVLASVISSLSDACDAVLYTSEGPGALDGVPAGRHVFKYRFSKCRLVTLLRYVRVQFHLFFKALKYDSDTTVFYINTLLPVGAALAGKMKGIRVIYHYHENAYIKGPHYRFLSRIMQKIADEIICVSEYQASFLGRKDRVTVISNALDERFVECAERCRQDNFSKRNILMLSSLNAYKGSDVFVNLSKSMPQYHFTLVLNEDEAAVENYRRKMSIDKNGNLTLMSRQRDVEAIYKEASIVLNLTDSDKVVETFGMTALEAMSFGLPVIVPVVGGIAGLVDDGVEGYRIDSHDIEGLKASIVNVLSDEDLYRKLSAAAVNKASKYTFDNMISSIKEII